MSVRIGQSVKTKKSMFRPIILLLLSLILSLAACGRETHLKIRYDETGALAAGDPLVMDEQVVGKVKRIKAGADGIRLVEVVVDNDSMATVTQDSAFLLDDDPLDPARKRIQILPGDPAEPPLADGATVQGSYPGLLAKSPFRALLKDFGDALRDFRGQVEGLERDLEKAPDSNEARKLGEEWRKLLGEIESAENAAEGAMKNELLPKLRQEMKDLRKKLEALPREGEKKAKPKEI
jgi:hypothetical protein